MEINIEGKDGWAKNLPTWKTPFTIFGRQMTGYHIYLMSVGLSLLIAPLAIYGILTIKTLFEIVSFFILVMVAEDILWFLLNPHYGIKRLKKEFADWHKVWILGLPIEYYLLITVAVILRVIV